MEELYKILYAKGLISDVSFEKIKWKHGYSLLSVHWEIKTLLYLGVLLLTAGLGLLIYENIDSIGHTFVLVLIAVISLGCFAYCFNHKLPFGTGKVNSPNASFDYILLLACTSFLIFAGYLQYQYHVFGDLYGMATFMPMLVLFFTAYHFDHMGILNMAIVNMAIWMGVSLTPKELLQNSDFSNGNVIYTYLLLGLLLIAGSYITQYLNFKKHFKFSYQHYGVHAVYISLLAGYFHFYEFPVALIWLFCITLFSFLIYQGAIKNSSFYFLLLIILYSYIALSSLVVRMLSPGSNPGIVAFVFIYFIASAIALVFLLINLNKKVNSA